MNKPILKADENAMELVKIDSHNVWKIVKLRVDDAQADFVASNAESIIEAFATRESGHVALPFGLCHEGTLVGFAMIGYDTIGDEDEPEIARGNYCLWRLMIDRAYQGRGFGKLAMATVLEYIAGKPCGDAAYCWLSYEPENEVARSLYHQFGFVENGETDGEEIVAVRRL